MVASERERILEAHIRRLSKRIATGSLRDPGTQLRAPILLLAPRARFPQRGTYRNICISNATIAEVARMSVHVAQEERFS